MRLVRRWGLPLLWAVVIFALSHAPQPGGSLPSPGLDKAAHSVLFAVLAPLVFRALLQGKAPTVQSAAQAILLSAIYGALDEVHQRFVPTRQCSLTDWLADVAGTIAGVLVLVLLQRRRSQQPPSARGE